MEIAIDLRVVELLSARLCHELIGPVAAVGNGAELLADDDGDFARQAIAMLRDSAAKAAARLQFFRFAYGYSRSGAIAGPPPHRLAAEYFAGSRIVCDYDASARALPPEWQKLACNLLLVGAEVLPRGGRLAVTADGARGIVVEGGGEGGDPSPALRSALVLAAPVGELTTRTVAAHFAGSLAAALGCRIAVTAAAPDRFRLASVEGSGTPLTAP